MEPATVLISELSCPLSRMAPSQLPSPKGWPNQIHLPANAVHDVHSSFALLRLSMEASGVSSSHHVSKSLNHISYTMSPRLEKVSPTTAFFVDISLHSPLELQFSLLILPTFRGLNLLLPSFLSTCIAIFQSLDSKPQGGSFSAIYHLAIFAEVSWAFFLKTDSVS